MAENFFAQFDDEESLAPVNPSAPAGPTADTAPTSTSITLPGDEGVEIPLSQQLLEEEGAPVEPVARDQNPFSEFDDAEPVGNFFSQFDDEDSYRTVPVDPEAEDETGFLGAAGNVALGVGDRISDLLGGLMITAGETSESIQNKFPMPGLVWGDGEGIRFVSGREYNRIVAEQKEKGSGDLTEFLKMFGRDVSNVDFGYEPMATWEEVKEAEGVLGTVGNAVQFGIEQGIVSLPDMAAILYTAPGYIVGRSGEIAYTRAQEDGRQEISDSDLMIGTGTAVIVSAFERFGAEKVLGAISTLNTSAVRRVFTAAVAETITEGAQESVEYVGERIGQIEMSFKEGADRALAGAVGGGVAGGGIRGTLEVAGAITGTDMGVGGQDQLAEDRQIAIQEVERIQREAEERAAQEGGDNLDQARAGVDAAAEAGSMAQAELAAKERGLAEADQQLKERQEAEYQEAAKRQAFDQAEREAAAQKAEETSEAEYQQELERGDQTAAVEEAAVAQEETTSDAPTLGDVAPELRKAKANIETQRAAKVTAERQSAGRQRTAERQREAIQKEPKKLEDLRPIVVGKDGTATTPAQLDAQIKQRVELTEQMELADVTTSPSNRIEPVPVKVGPLNVLIENPKGTTRTGSDENGTWQRTLKDHYGEIRNTKGADGDKVDVFLSAKSPDYRSGKVYVVDQVNQDTGEFDEHKAMIGYGSEMDARRAYKRNYESGWKVGAITEMTMAEFDAWVKDGRKKNVPAGAIPTLGTTTPTSEADVQSEIDRKIFKGGGRPKVLYRLGDAEVTVREVDTGATVGAIFEATVGGKRVGGMRVEKHDGRLQIHQTSVIGEARGQQHGQRLILEALQYAERQGQPLTSDMGVSVAQLRAYEALRKKGLIVIEYRNEAEVQRALREESDGFSVVEEGPVITRMFRPEFSEDIRYRDDLEGRPTEPITASEAEIELAALLDQLSGLEVQVLDSRRDAPSSVQAQMEEDNRTGAKGLYDATTGQLFVFADRHNSMDDVVETILHEGVAHKGLRLVFGDDLDGLLDRVWEGGNQAAINRIAKSYDLDTSNEAERRQATEEYIAHLAETTPDSTVLQQVIDKIRQFLREAGLLEKWTDSDINALLRDVRREIHGKPLNKIEFTHEAEIEETGEVVEIVETADKMLRQVDRRRRIVERLRECVAA